MLPLPGTWAPLPWTEKPGWKGTQAARAACTQQDPPSPPLLGLPRRRRIGTQVQEGRTPACDWSFPWLEREPGLGAHEG